MSAFKYRWQNLRVAGCLLVAPLAMESAVAQSFSEPATVFYGKVIGTGSAQDFLITDGNLSWTIQRANGSHITLNTTLFPLNDRSLSYRLDVPHTAFSLGLEKDSGTVSLPPSPQTLSHQQITVDGEPARLIGPSDGMFTTEQLLRTATYRLDLALGREAVDSDGDGAPDDWEDRYSLDKQNPADAANDLSGDGLSALEGYLRGLDPHHDTRTPALLTHEMVVYPFGSTGVLLDTADVNSAPDQLTYTLTGQPATGTLLRRNARPDPSNPDAILVLGDNFTQEDLLSGRVLYVHDGSSADPGNFSVEVRDEDPGHPPANGQVQLLVHAPLTAGGYAAEEVDSAVLSAAGHVVLDGSPYDMTASLSTPSTVADDSQLAGYLADFGHDRPYLLIGGSDQSLSGGEANDLLAAGAGELELSGGSGSDMFIIRKFDEGRVGISDFSLGANDLIDLSRLPSSPGAWMHEHLRLATASGEPEIQVDLDGDGQGFTNLTVALPGLPVSEADLYRLVESGHVNVGSLELEPRITVSVSESQASENGSTPGRFTLRREGSLADALEVNIDLSGSAQNGVDFAWIQPEVFIPAGTDSVDLEVVPHRDSVTEPGESVELLVRAGTGYHVGESDQATIIIEDLLMLLELEVLESVAVKDTASPAIILISRRDLLDRDVLVRLDVGGSAAGGSDYHVLPGFVLMNPHQTSALLEIIPKPGATITAGMETIVISIQEDPAYRITGSGAARISLVERLDRLADWQAREFPTASSNLIGFVQGDTGNLGITHLERYAFGLDPHAPDAAGLPHSMMIDGQFVLTFRKPASISDVKYLVTGATDLERWAGSAVVVEEMPAPAGATDAQQVYYRLNAAADGSKIGFVVLELEWTP